MLAGQAWGAMTDLIDENESGKLLKRVPEWDIESGKRLVREFEFDDFSGAIDFVNSVAEIAEDADHHPDIDIRWNKVTLSLSTHSKGGLTANDFELAERIDNLDN